MAVTGDAVPPPLRLIADPVRWRLLRELAGGDLRVRELVAATGEAQNLVSYHLRHQRPMLGAFLDALGIAHQNGVLKGEDLAAPKLEQLKAAAASLRAAYATDISDLDSQLAPYGVDVFVAAFDPMAACVGCSGVVAFPLRGSLAGGADSLHITWGGAPPA